MYPFDSRTYMTRQVGLLLRKLRVLSLKTRQSFYLRMAQFQFGYESLKAKPYILVEKMETNSHVACSVPRSLYQPNASQTLQKLYFFKN